LLFFSVLSGFHLILSSHSSNIFLSSLYEQLFDNLIKKEEMGGICDTSGGEERYKQSFGGAT
jgi:hypothetical protein